MYQYRTGTPSKGHLVCVTMAFCSQVQKPAQAMPGPTAWMAGAAVSTIALMTTGKTSRSILSTMCSQMNMSSLDKGHFPLEGQFVFVLCPIPRT
jgi:hypothetical protein